MGTKVLIADDDGHIRQVVRFALEQAGFEVVEAASGTEAWNVFTKENPSVLVLDIVMPGESGLELCKRIREQSKVPILFVSSRDEELDRILGLELGGDDYIGKPFSVRELVSRVKAILRRTATPSEKEGPSLEVLVRGDLRIVPERHECTWAGAAVVLTATEFALLMALAKRPGVVFSREQLVAQAYGDDHYITERTVDSHVRRLRKKLSAVGADPVETVYGVGYRLRDSV